ncbi:NAD(P)-binding domain-containing protein [Microbacterium lushaniae]|uniref:NAD(P)-dependent oxidoreductase n=1 Tax=Microbacterium lushaniae TaxID=2614639 RepID=A0A5J6L800_9MICO|nr:NAD(P)-dependent oxidoreductase [Microbacterium lushaniae]QEW04551.1 NAD(P)-dependent oxidoreductase [Microbacterium lushaniae]
MTKIAVIGLGEAGTLYARGLRASGAEVRGYDPHVRADDAVAQYDEPADAVTGADVVLSLVWARTAVAAAERVIPLLPRGAVYADLNTAAPEVKERVAAIGDAHGVAVADVAVLAPVPRAGERTALLASGAGASLFADFLRPLGAPVEVLDAPAGDAAKRKLLRSVFMKGLAALVIEGLEAARATGTEEWLREQMAREFGPGGAAKVDHLVTGTHRHIERREQEVRDALAILEAEGRHADITRATLAWYDRILAER